MTKLGDSENREIFVFDIVKQNYMNEKLNEAALCKILNNEKHKKICFVSD